MKKSQELLTLVSGEGITLSGDFASGYSAEAWVLGEYIVIIESTNYTYNSCCC